MDEAIRLRRPDEQVDEVVGAKDIVQLSDIGLPPHQVRAQGDAIGLTTTFCGSLSEGMLP
jgi:hypothetical protein